MTVEGGAGRRVEGWLTGWGPRILFGTLLALCAILAMAAGGLWFATFIAAATLAGAREWQRLIGPDDPLYPLLLTALAIVAPLALAGFASRGDLAPYLIGLAIIVLAVPINFAAAPVRGARAQWQAAGPLYLGLPALSLYVLRAVPAHGAFLVLLLFVAVWGCDSGAMLTGKLFGGPKFLPHLSPNKTWAGYLGGLIFGALAAALVAAGLGGDALHAGLSGLAIAAVAHGGDMFESWVKRRFGAKDSGTAIPGHGGVLDRIDSLLFAAPAVLLVVLAAGPDLILGGSR